MKTKVLTFVVFAFIVSITFYKCSQDKKQAGEAAESTAKGSEAVEPETDDREIGLKLYGIRSGIIEYKHTGTRTGTSKLYFDRYGHRSATYSDLVMNNQPDKGWIISFDEMQYMYKEGNKQGAKMKNPMIEGLAKVNDLEKFVEETYNKMGFKPSGNEMHLGKECRVFKGEMGKVLTWNGLLMFMEMNVMGTITRQEATRIDVNVPVKKSVFELPTDVTFSEMNMFGSGGM